MLRGRNYLTVKNPDLQPHWETHQQWWARAASVEPETAITYVSLLTGLTSWMQSDGPHLLYVDSNQHVSQLWYTASAGTARI
jgi:hypothetical protein